MYWLFIFLDHLSPDEKNSNTKQKNNSMKLNFSISPRSCLQAIKKIADSYRGITCFFFFSFLSTKTPNKSWNYVSYISSTFLWDFPALSYTGKRFQLEPRMKLKNIWAFRSFTIWKLASKNVHVTRTCSWYFIISWVVRGLSYWDFTVLWNVI